MSTHTSKTKITTAKIKSMKGKGRIVSLTAYTKNITQLMDPYVDLIIVGDSLGMVAFGFDSTLRVTVEMMISHGSAVVRGAETSCVIVDMPFGSYQESKQLAYKNAAKVMAQTGAQGIKIEGGPEMLETVEFLIQRGIPVMPHIGLCPQYANVLGGFKVQGKTQHQRDYLIETARKFEKVGAFSLLVEGVDELTAREITRSVSIPTIGIGASPECDGQVLVTEDMLGLFTEYTPKFVKKYIDLSQLIKTSFSEYEQEVRNGAFPTREHCFD